MKKLWYGSLLLGFFMVYSSAWANATVFSDSVSKDCLRTIKRVEYKEGLPNGLLHSISLVETNIGQTERYYPWPYTVRLNSFKAQKVNNVDDAFEQLDYLIDLGFKTFDLTVNDDKYYSLSASNLEDQLNLLAQDAEIYISARSTIKYLKNKAESKEFINNLLDNGWYDFKVGVMQLSYETVKSETDDISEALNVYTNTSIMVKELKKLRQSKTWWEAVGAYHSKQETKAKRYVKNVWSMYQRVHKIKVR